MNSSFGFTFLSPSSVEDVPLILKQIIGLAKKELLKKDMTRFSEELAKYFRSI